MTNGIALLRIEETAQILGISRSQVYAMVAAGELPSVRIGRSRRVPVRQLKEWVEQHVIGVSQPAPGQAGEEGSDPVVGVGRSERGQL